LSTVLHALREAASLVLRCCAAMEATADATQQMLVSGLPAQVQRFTSHFLSMAQGVRACGSSAACCYICRCRRQQGQTAARLHILLVPAGRGGTASRDISIGGWSVGQGGVCSLWRCGTARAGRWKQRCRCTAARVAAAAERVRCYQRRWSRYCHLLGMFYCST
jgi:hypothetical protein